jgi:hypothetical protein
MNVPTTRQLLEDIYHDRGRLTPADVVDVAQSEDHPLHDRFTWDDGEAAEKWRLEEASHLIRTTRVVREIVDHGKARVVVVRAFPNIAGEDYIPMDVVLGRPDLEQALLEEMRADIRELERKYKAHLALFHEVLTSASA